MASKLEGLPQYIHDAVARIAPANGFTPGNFRISFETGSGKGDGFAGDMFRARISEDSRELVVLCKVPPVNEARREYFGAMAIFEREFQAYSSLLPAMYEFQREKGVTEELGIGFFNAPKCFLAYYEAEKQETAILMEDLRLRGYRMWNKMVPVDYEHVKLLMVQLGRLHAVSFAMKDQRPETFEQFKLSDPFNAMIDGNEPMMNMLQASFERAIGLVNPDDTNLHPKLLSFKSTLFQDLKNIMNPALCEPYAVLGHGDCWINNMIYSYKNGVPTEIILLDWQITRYVSPALDLLYFIFCCTDGDFRLRHYGDMMRTYHASLKELLEKLGGDASRQFPYTALLRQLKQHGKFGLLMASCLIPMLVMENQDLPDMEQMAEQFGETKNMTLEFKAEGQAEERYRKRMGDVLRDVVKFGYI